MSVLPQGTATMGDKSVNERAITGHKGAYLSGDVLMRR